MPAGGYDIVYATCPFVVETYCARKIARRLGVPWVVKIQHVLSTQTQRTGLINRLLLWGEIKSAKWANQGAAKIFCLSPSVSRDYRALEEKLGLEASDTETIGSSINLDQFSVLPEAEKKYDVVFLGRIHSLKGVFDLPDVWAQVKGNCTEATLTVIGEGPHRGAVMARFKERGLMEGVRFVGSVPEEEKNQLLSEARIGLSLSSEEGWGLAVNEYLACGLPVVAYDLPVFREIFPDLLDSVPLGDKALVSKTILGLLDNRDIREQHGQIGRDYVQRYNYREMALRELEHLKNLCIA
jgi:glycosyltransferase involved in cell wall biosynthesis